VLTLGSGVNDNRGGAFNTFVWGDDYSRTIGTSALARNYQGLLTKSDPQRDDRNACFALRQTSGWGFHQFPLSTAFAE